MGLLSCFLPYSQPPSPPEIHRHRLWVAYIPCCADEAFARRTKGCIIDFGCLDGFTQNTTYEFMFFPPPVLEFFPFHCCRSLGQARGNEIGWLDVVICQLKMRKPNKLNPKDKHNEYSLQDEWEVRIIGLAIIGRLGAELWLQLFIIVDTSF